MAIKSHLGTKDKFEQLQDAVRKTGKLPKEAQLSRRMDYENMVSLLHHNPHYLADMARLLRPDEADKFVKSLFKVFDCNPRKARDEHALLAVITMLLKERFNELTSDSKPEDVLAPTALVTKVLAHYTRREPCLDSIRGILQVPMKNVLKKTFASLTQEAKLRLDCSPAEVYVVIYLYIPCTIYSMYYITVRPRCTWSCFAVR
jgi:hypothetical protein